MTGVHQHPALNARLTTIDSFGRGTTERKIESVPLYLSAKNIVATHFPINAQVMVGSLRSTREYHNRLFHPQNTV